MCIRGAFPSYGRSLAQSFRPGPLSPGHSAQPRLITVSRQGTRGGLSGLSEPAGLEPAGTLRAPAGFAARPGQGGPRLGAAGSGRGRDAPGGAAGGQCSWVACGEGGGFGCAAACRAWSAGRNSARSGFARPRRCRVRLRAGPDAAAEDLVVIDEENADPARLPGVLVHPSPFPAVRQRPRRVADRRGADRRGVGSGRRRGQSGGCLSVLLYVTLSLSIVTKSWPAKASAAGGDHER
jgi:hypothetical protein